MRLTTRQIDKMRMLYESGESVPAIEQRLKITAKTIYNYVNKHGWKRKALTAALGEEIVKVDHPLAEAKNCGLQKVQHIEHLSSVFLRSLGSTPEELSRIDDNQLNRVIKGLKALKLATEITDTNFTGVTKGFAEEKVDDELSVLPIHIEVNTSKEAEEK